MKHDITPPTRNATSEGSSAHFLGTRGRDSQLSGPLPAAAAPPLPPWSGRGAAGAEPLTAAVAAAAAAVSGVGAAAAAAAAGPPGVLAGPGAVELLAPAAASPPGGLGPLLDGWGSAGCAARGMMHRAGTRWAAPLQRAGRLCARPLAGVPARAEQQRIDCMEGRVLCCLWLPRPMLCSPGQPYGMSAESVRVLDAAVRCRQKRPPVAGWRGAAVSMPDARPRIVRNDQHPAAVAARPVPGESEQIGRCPPSFSPSCPPPRDMPAVPPGPSAPPRACCPSSPHRSVHAETGRPWPAQANARQIACIERWSDT
jgi:hypothetical protein